jgi:hypothetical protein
MVVLMEILQVYIHNYDTFYYHKDILYYHLTTVDQAVMAKNSLKN